MRSVIRCLFRLRLRRTKWPYRISASTFIEDTHRVPCVLCTEEQLFARQIKACGKAKAAKTGLAERKQLTAQDRKLFFSLMLKKREVNLSSHWNDYTNVSGVLVMNGKYKRQPCATLP